MLSYVTQNLLQEHYVALAGSLDREVEARIEQEPGTESKAKKLTRSKTNTMLVVNSILFVSFSFCLADSSKSKQQENEESEKILRWRGRG